MLRITALIQRSHLRNIQDLERVNRRRAVLEERRQRESAFYTPPVEPTRRQAVALYRAMLKEGNRTLRLTDKTYYRTRLRYEFEEVARQTSARVRGIMYEKGLWMLENKLGGIV
jgi:hypothetical protein